MEKGGVLPRPFFMRGKTVSHERSDVGGGLSPPLRLSRSAPLGLFALVLCAMPVLAQTAPPADACRQTLAQTVEFASDKTTLDGTARALVRRQATCLEAIGGNVTIEAFWDDSATQPRARELSLRLATRVREELVKSGVAETRLTTVGHGRDKSLDPDRPTERRRVVRLVVAAGA
jgi:outer membrane protein OmpA-like peptidoglycan-associated protein